MKKCLKCQLNSPVSHQPPEELSSVLSPIPFAIWGIYILGPLPKGKGHASFVIAAIDYITKWVEAKSLQTITENECLKFFKDVSAYRTRAKKEGDPVSEGIICWGRGDVSV